MKLRLFDTHRPPPQFSKLCDWSHRALCTSGGRRGECIPRRATAASVTRCVQLRAGSSPDIQNRARRTLFAAGNGTRTLLRLGNHPALINHAWPRKGPTGATAHLRQPGSVRNFTSTCWHEPIKELSSQTDYRDVCYDCAWSCVTIRAVREPADIGRCVVVASFVSAEQMKLLWC